ncbi:hypothetical protein [Halolamina sediminis]|uniref:hypothetical protein n=1 Tax=Halolamina sediminis TaxID=1480675 RepID=UPI0006B5C7E9|nr:hypothetical protein [Halolamina sediminis]
MSDKQFTLFELHFHDGFQLGPRSLDLDDGTASNDAIDESTTDAVEESSEGSGPSVLGPLLGLGVLAGVAYAVRKLLSDIDPEGLDALDDVEEEVQEATEDLEADEDSVPIEITSPDEEESSGLLRLLAGAAVLLVLFALGAKKLLGGSEEIVVEE